MWGVVKRKFNGMSNLEKKKKKVQAYAKCKRLGITWREMENKTKLYKTK